MKCMYCGSENITERIQASQSVEAGWVGLCFSKGFLIGSEPLLTDICLNCGTVVRMYVDNPNQKWYIKKKK